MNRPVETHEGKLIDGRHRLRACTELGVKPDIIEADVGGSASAQKTALAWAGQGR